MAVLIQSAKEEQKIVPIRFSGRRPGITHAWGRSRRVCSSAHADLSLRLLIGRRAGRRAATGPASTGRVSELSRPSKPHAVGAVRMFRSQTVLPHQTAMLLLLHVRS